MGLFGRKTGSNGAGPHPSAEQVRAACAAVPYPGFNRTIGSFGLVRDVEVDGPRVSVTLGFKGTIPPVAEAIERNVRQAIAGLGADLLADVRVLSVAPEAPPVLAAPAGAPAAPPPPPGLEMGPGVRPRGADPWASRAAIEGVRYVVAVASGKGGVGKSTVAVNLALALQRLGLTTGLLDLDVFGPSVPTMLGVDDTPTVVDGTDIIVPLEAGGLKVMSIGFLLGDDAPVIWRGPMVMQMVMQFLRKVKWAPLDVLVLDLPPGTGDTQLTLVQNVPLDGVVVVTTPSDVALIDVKRALSMFAKVETPVIGVVENMSAFRCPHCHETSYVFSQGGGAKVAAETGVPFLGEIPLDGAIRLGGDSGRPVMLADPSAEAAQPFVTLAQQVLAAIRTPTFEVD